MWQSIAFFSVETEKPENALEFNFWTSTTETDSDSYTSKVSVQILRENQVIAESRSPVITSSQNGQFISTALRQPKLVIFSI